MDAESSGPNLMLLSLNLSDSEPEEGVAPGNSTTTTAGPTAEYQPTRAERTALSEDAFQALKRSYRPKVENGNIHTTIPLPLPPTPLPKPQAQALLHAAEELYFLRRYAEAAAFVRRVLEDEAEVEVEAGDDGDESEGKGERGKGDGSKNGNEDGEAESGGVRKAKAKTKTGRRGRGKGRIDDETKRLLAYYLERCEARAREGNNGGGSVGVSVS
ncbi:hypothetical protein F5144DRAFT_144799 [Chaetomium tenue]|uniref:Uncharacterized protein n=1 Tax=Chaetomium tenue TaxID=1854479 RepID=A0ACB7PKW8_9PEZI|nr:hypothetical protein F5144DRAFT_144799 [Chaetomium globosum]